MSQAFLVLVVAIVLGALLGSLRGPAPAPRRPAAFPFTAIFPRGSTASFTISQSSCKITLFLRQQRDPAPRDPLPYTYHELRTRFGLTDEQIAAGPWVPVMISTTTRVLGAWAPNPLLEGPF